MRNIILKICVIFFLNVLSGLKLNAQNSHSKTINSISAMCDFSGPETTLVLSDTLRGGIFTYSPASRIADSVLIYPATGKGHGVWMRKLTESNVYEASWWGITGDGIHDETKKIQNAQDFVYSHSPQKGKLRFKKGKFILTRTMYIYGPVSWVGAGSKLTEIHLHGNYGNSVDTTFSIAFGIKQKRVNSAWQNASFEGFKICLDKGVKTDNALNLFLAKDVAIKNNNFYFDEADSVGGWLTAIESRHNSAWSTGPYVRNIVIANNYLTAKHSAKNGEAIGLTIAHGFSITNNYIKGFGDDGIGIHNCTDGTIRGNKLYLLDGRIYISNSQDINVIKNYVTRIADPKGRFYGGGAFIMTDMEYGDTLSTNKYITIDSNTVELPAQIPSVTYLIRAQGIQSGIISNNVIISNSSLAQSSIVISPDKNPAWKGRTTDPDYKKGVVSPRNILVYNNICKGTHPAPIIENAMSGTIISGPVYYCNNVTPSYKVIGNNSLLLKETESTVLNVQKLAASVNVNQGFFKRGKGKNEFYIKTLKSNNWLKFSLK